MNYTKELVDMLSYYVGHPERRALDDQGTCMYSWCGRRCAVGRLLTDEQAKVVEGEFLSIKQCMIRLESAGLPAPFSEMDLEFLGQLQGLHDNEENWEEGELCYEGRCTVRGILSRFGDGTVTPRDLNCDPEDDRYA